MSHTPLPSLEGTLTLAAGGRGTVSPNPMVGACVVRDDRVVGRGYHGRYGGPHAETVALDEAGEAARGGTLYCNLEPCSFTAPDKHQPPCTRRIIEAGVRRVVIGQLDPNPRVSGRGVEELRRHGIEVEIARDATEFWRFNDAFNTWMALRRPFVHLKTAMSLDGRVATTAGDSRWITGTEARARGHRFRSERDAIGVGIGTVLADDPILTNRHGRGTDPRPVVFDSHLRIPLESALVSRRGKELVVVCSGGGTDDAGTWPRYPSTGPVEAGTEVPGARTERPTADPGTLEARKRALEEQGVTIVSVALDTDGRPDLTEAIQHLARLGITSILVEGGPTLLTSFLRAGLYDRISAFIAPTLIGSGRDAVGDLGIEYLRNAIDLEQVRWESVGDDQLLDAYRPGWLAEVTSVISTSAAVGVGAAAPAKEVHHVHRAG
ncbi:MAG: bifunctional diaminohydroxyphosphoribosylaminopyrimidine deaminase/5-amino-6-(5-phosphoribosylamino)uracil reductase RibD [Alkalispirochaeta sp.]